MRFFAAMFTEPETVGLQRLERIAGESQRYGSPGLGTNGLVRDQWYRTDHDAGMPTPD